MSGGGAPAGGGPCRVSDSGARSPSPAPRIGAVRSFPAFQAGYVPDTTGPDLGHLPHPRSGRGFSFPLPGVEARGLGIAASGPHGFVCFLTGHPRPAWASVPPRSGEKLPEESRWPWSPVVGSGSAPREETRGAALSALSQRTHQSPQAAVVEGPGPDACGGPAPRRSALGAPAARPAAAPRSSVLAHTPPRRDSGGCRAPAPFPEGWRRPHPPLRALTCALFLLRWRRGPAPCPLERDDSTDLGPERRVSRPGAGWFAQEEGPRSGLCLGLPGLVQSRAASLGGRADPG